MSELPLLPLLSLYLMLSLMGLLSIIVLGWQVLVLRGWRMKNPDGSADSYGEQKTHFGIAVADVCVSVPVTIIGIGMVLAQNRWGFFLLALASFWLIWANVMTTATSLRFQRPTIDLVWFLTFPFGALLGVGYLIWFMLCFDIALGG
jgi:hypothetical protein